MMHRPKKALEARHFRDHPNTLHRAPSTEQLCEHGNPDFEFMTLEGGAQCRYGIRFTDRPRHMFIAGTTGGGRSGTARAVIRGIDSTSNADGRRISMIVMDPKGGVFSDLRRKMGEHWLHYSKDGPPLLSLTAPTV